ncbi:protein disulfide oxidoreductase [Pseudidiomarina taiwanensis]|uniref:Protein disulfide oxidoreductase n=1 Tax=Pseudidiomarina taiwanensis TaxID=337250 RepID=A0A432ZFD9_9GAMM|nr:protein disulfide oxidoreductase [Pseudidiomarina taiwanensis]RUO76653.1 protein disulfide oxidoreductase [Pseudidiomarina taiwanensis]
MQWLKQGLIYLVLILIVVTIMDLWRGKDLPKGVLTEQVWQTTQGEQVNVVAQSFKEPVIIYFWGTWCPVCSVVTPSVDWLDGMAPVVSVAMQSGTDASLRHYAAEHGYTVAMVNDASGSLGQSWGVAVTPAFAIVRNGEIESFTAGFTTPFGLYIRWLLAH